MFPSESLDGSPLREVPYPDSLVLATGYNQFVLWMEYRIGHVIKMSSTRIDFPRLCLAHPPNFDGPIVCSGYNQW